MDPASDFIPLSEAAVLLREPPITLYHRVIRGELQGTRSGRAWMVPRAAVEALLADRAKAAGDPLA